MKTKNTPSWTSKKLSPALKSTIPKKSGVYAIGKSHRVLGLLCEWDLLYIGKASDLQKRYSEHFNPLKEHNVKLRKALSAPSKLEFWYAVLPKSELDKYERELIREGDPTFNEIRYKEDENV